MAGPVLYAAAGMLCFSSASHAAEPLKQPGAWAQTYTGRAADPAVRFGQLANGMRYAILRNSTPAKQASLRLRIGSGSLSERDDQQGLAHFLEHMAFKGSTHVPGGDMVQILQRKGLSFGADTNAETDWDQTVYKLNLPENDEDSLDTGLMLLREIGSELTLSQAAMDPERGVVLSEERTRDTPAFQSAVRQIQFSLAGQLAGRRLPIGKVDILQHAPVSLIREFYDAEYRPDNATVIAVGDFDVDRMEAKIKARFGDWRPKPAKTHQVDLGQVESRGTNAEVFAGQGAPEYIAVTWVSPSDKTADTLARERRDTLQLLATSVLNRRLGVLAQAANAPFIGANAGREETLKSAQIAQINIQPKAGAWREALAAVLTEQRRLVQFGVRQEELDREIEQLLAQFTSAAAGASTRPTSNLIDEFVKVENDDDVFTSPAQDLAEFNAEIQGSTAAEVSAAAKAIFTGSGPLVFVSSQTPVAGGAAAVTKAVGEILTAPVAVGAIQVKKSWPYASFGAPGRVVSRREIQSLGVSDVRFANGVRLLVKPTPFAKDEIKVGVRVGSGRLGASKALARSLWAASAAAPVVVLGGTKELTFEEVQQILTAKVAGVQFATDDDAFVLSGKTRPQDFDVQLQLLTAYTTRPGLRPQAFDRVKSALTAQLPQLKATALGVMALEANAALHGNDPRFRILPKAEDLAASQPADLESLVGPGLESGPIEVSIVGDVTPDRAIEAVARTYGALPTRRGERPAAFQVIFPQAKSEPTILVHTGRADQAAAFEAWATDDFFANPQEVRAVGVMTEVLKNRLVDRLRVAQGATYSPMAENDSSEVFRGFGFVDAYVETPVDKVPGFFTEMDKIAAELRTAPPTADEMTRAKTPRVEQRLKMQQSNDYWVAALGEIDHDPRAETTIGELVSGVQKVTAEDVLAVSKKYLRDDRTYRLVVRAATVQ
jgi:zinc protease